MGEVAIIGGTGLSALSHADVYKILPVDTPYGAPSGDLMFVNSGGKKLIFLARHGQPPVVAPHKVNYRANIYALKEHDVDRIIAVNAVGGITAEMYPGRVVIPEQIIDYTYSRQHTFYDESVPVVHVDFTHPYSDSLRKKLLALEVLTELDAFVGGVYAVTQGPRLETAAEIQKLANDGCDIVGMTGMPEAGLARELDIHYVCLALVVNWAAGKTATEMSMDTIKKELQQHMSKINWVLERFIATL